MATARTRRRTLTVAIGTTALVTVLYLSGGVVSGLRGTANIVVAPFSWVIDVMARPIGHMLAGVVNYSDVVAQNQKFRFQLGQDELRLNESWALERQLQQMTTQLHVPFVGSLPMVAAQVTALSPTNFAATVDISQGRDNGVLVGMPVVANGGLVGSVITTTPHGATVRLITDVNSAIGVTFGSGRSSLVVSGRGVNNGLGAIDVPLTSTINPGTVFSTDGLSGGLYPPGLPVATVSKVSLTPGASTFNLTLHPTADVQSLMYVEVVLWEPTP